MQDQAIQAFLNEKFNELIEQLHVNKQYEAAIHELEKDVLVFMEKYRQMASDLERVMNENNQLKYDNKQLKLLIDTKLALHNNK